MLFCRHLELRLKASFEMVDVEANDQGKEMFANLLVFFYPRMLHDFTFVLNRTFNWVMTDSVCSCL